MIVRLIPQQQVTGQTFGRGSILKMHYVIRIIKAKGHMHNPGRPRLSRAPVRVMSAVVHYPLHRFTYSTAGETVSNITIPAYTFQVFQLWCLFGP